MTDPAEQTDNRPASRRVADALLRRIDTGEYPVGSALPTYRQIAAEYEVATNTALAAVRLLGECGAVALRRNARAQVRDRTTHVDYEAEVRAVGEEVAQVRGDVQAVAARLASLEERIVAISSQPDR